MVPYSADPTAPVVSRLEPAGGGSSADAQLALAQRAARGRAARTEVPRRSHGAWNPSPNRPDPIALLEQQATTRVPELVPIRYGRMLASPFAFFRGAALIMAADLAPTPRSGLRVQLCGDAHLSNFGVFGTPERNLVFDINDFDETHPGPWEWDVKRLAASIVVAGRERGFAAGQRQAAVLAATEQYRTALRRFTAMTNLAVWYAHIDVDQVLTAQRASVGRGTAARTAAGLAKARTRDSVRALARLTTVVDGEPRIVSDPPLIVPMEELLHGQEHDQALAWLQALIRDYGATLPPDRRRLLEQYHLVHAARKVVGVGSVGTRAWITLSLGHDGADPLFLQVKEAQSSVLEPFLGRSEYANSGQRVVAGQELMQAASDVFLGWLRVDRDLDGQARDYYLRQLYDWKGSADITQLSARELVIYSKVCGWTLARAHARSGDRAAIAAYLGAGSVFDNAIAAFAEVYADQNERDYQALQLAVRSGRIKAATGL
jgi:uncharacterized protein (DUF2252 family)